jgi:peptidoglycan/LPS O-acetylase OafA/YrhL
MALNSNQALDGAAGEEECVKVGHDARSIQVGLPEVKASGSGMQREAPSRKETHNTDFIDSIRGLAALSIVAFHLYFVPAAHLAISGGLLNCISRLGSGVPLFFIISGLTLSLSESRRKHSNYIAFLTRRLFRIFPLYLVVLSIMLVLGEFYWHAKFPSRGDLLLYISLLFNFFPRHVEGLVWASWSLSVEIIFYLFFPLIFKRVRLGYRPKIAFLLCTLILSVVAKAILVPMAAFSSGGNDHFIYFSVFTHLPFFATGMVLYSLLFENAERRNAKKAIMSPMAWFALFLLIYSYSKPLVIDTIYIQGSGLACLILSMALSQKNIIVNRITLYLGKISYSLYLIHVFVIMFIFPSIRAHTIALLRLPGDVWYFIYLCLVVSITAAIASVTYYLIELPFIRLGHKLASKMSSANVRQPQPAPKSFLMPVNGDVRYAHQRRSNCSSPGKLDNVIAEEGSDSTAIP